MDIEPERKKAVERDKTRNAILDAAETIMREAGYAAVTSRRVEEKAQLKSKLLHYHFATMDDLFMALYERSTNEFLERLSQALASDSPLEALWELSIHPKRTALAIEMIALSNHRKLLRKQIADSLARMHVLQIAAITKNMQEIGLNAEEYPPTIMSYIIYGVARALVTEAAIGATHLHSEVLDFAKQWMQAKAVRRGPTGSEGTV